MNYVYRSIIYEIFDSGAFIARKGQEDVRRLELFRCYLELIDESNRWIVSRRFYQAQVLSSKSQDEQDVDNAKSMFEQEFDEYEQSGASEKRSWL